MDIEVKEEIAAMKRELTVIEHEFNGILLGVLADELKKYNANQPRVPAGNSDGGQWTSGGGSGDNRNIKPKPVASKPSLVSDKKPEIKPSFKPENSVSDNNVKPVKPKKIASSSNYKPAKDKLWKLGYDTYGKIAKGNLEQRSQFIEKVSQRYGNVSPDLIRGVITNEVITRGWAGLGEAVVSYSLSDFGTYGPAQLGPEARQDVDINIVEALTYEGSIVGAASFLDKQRIKLIQEGVKNPTNSQIASRYNKGKIEAGKVTKYGHRVQYIIENLYNNK